MVNLEGANHPSEVALIDSRGGLGIEFLERSIQCVHALQPRLFLQIAP